MKLVTSLVATLIATTTVSACKLIGSASTKSSTAPTAMPEQRCWSDQDPEKFH
ncbi:MAG: hypothetical protein WKG01_17770 [Kofleriaceae bacterium]